MILKGEPTNHFIDLGNATALSYIHLEYEVEYDRAEFSYDKDTAHGVLASRQEKWSLEIQE